MLTNEQIINIIKNWDIEYAKIENGCATIALIDRTQDYQFIATLYKDRASNNRRIRICKKYNDTYISIYLLEGIDEHIHLNFDYLVTTRAEEWVKTNIGLMLAIEPAVGFDALV